MNGEQQPRQDGERLAAYLVGDLDPAERDELEARLSDDPVLRARLEAIRRLDEGLDGLADVGPRPEFSARLRDELRPAVREQLAGDTDDLAARRRRREDGRRSERGTPSWLMPLGAAAAGLALFAVIGVGVANLSGGDDSGDSGVAMETMEAGDGTAEQPGPIVVAQGRSYTTEDVAAITDDPAFQPVLGLDAEAAEAASDSYLSAFGTARTSEDDAITEAQGGDGDAAATDEAAELRAPPAALQVRGEASEDDLVAVRDCLPQLFEAAGTVVPVYAELAEFEGEPALVYGLVSDDGESDRLTRIEVWVIGRDDCEVRYFTQQDR